MANLGYNIRQLFADFFGVNAPVYTIPENKQAKANIDYSGLEQLPDNYKGEATSWMGTPIVFPAKFKGGSYNRYKMNGELEKVSLNDLQLPAATMFSFRRSKNIERTNLLGANGTVKEIYGFDDWVIDVRGICLDEPGSTAHDQYERLLQWERIADAIGISGRLFNQKEIDAVAMSDWSDNVVQGKPGAIPFSFQLFSDEPIELAIQLRL